MYPMAPAPAFAQVPGVQKNPIGRSLQKVGPKTNLTYSPGTVLPLRQGRSPGCKMSIPWERSAQVAP